MEKEKERVCLTDEKKQNETPALLSKLKSPVKRRKKYSNTSSSERMKTLRDKLDDDQKSKIKDNNKKRKTESRDKLDDDKKSKIKDNKERMKESRDKKKDERNDIFNNVQTNSMVDPCILETPAFKLIEEDFKSAIKEGPTYICDICWKLEFRKNVIKLKDSKYETDLYNECTTKKSEWICKSCHNSMLKNKIPMQAQVNNLVLCPTFDELDNLCPIELMLISQIIPFMFIVAKIKGAQHGLKGQCVLVPTDLKKIQTILPRSCNEEYLISLALKRRLTDKSVVHKQQIRPAFVNRALQKLTEINPFYKDVIIDNEWEDLSEQSDPELWKLLTNENVREPNNGDQTDSDDNIEGNDKLKEREMKKSSLPFPTVMHNIDGPNITPSEIVNIAPGEGQIPVSFTSEPNWEPLAFPKDYSTGRNHFN